MTILQAITQADALRHNGYTPEEKVQWLSQLDGKVAKLILETHQGEHRPFSGYTRHTPMDTVLLVDAPFEELYVYWLEAQICYADGEMSDYNGAISQFNQLFSVFSAAYNREHPWARRGERFLF